MCIESVDKNHDLSALLRNVDSWSTQSDILITELQTCTGTQKVASLKDVEAIIEEGFGNRTVAATAMNSQSSRSHCILQVMVESQNITTKERRIGKLTLVDLAGSEVPRIAAFYFICIYVWEVHSASSLLLQTRPSNMAFNVAALFLASKTKRGSRTAPGGSGSHQ